MENLNKKSFFKQEREAADIREKIDELAKPYRDRLNAIDDNTKKYEEKAYKIAIIKYHMDQYTIDNDHIEDRRDPDNKRWMIKFKYDELKRNRPGISPELVRYNISNWLQEPAEYGSDTYEVEFHSNNVKVFIGHSWRDEEYYNYVITLTWDEFDTDVTDFLNDAVEEILLYIVAEERSDEAWEKHIEKIAEENEKKEREEYLKLKAKYEK
jgi:hypothetical protein